jgi:3'-phosphoadenosine 5'-phosphosulfate sulfotransferase (PAPS reductase)/FAD synthetase
MAYKLKENYSDQFNLIYTFANTGCEHEKTLEFLNNCDKEWGLNVVWLEAVPQEHGKSNGWKRVTFETASRNGGPYEASVKKYGMVGIATPKCTDRLKYIPMNNYKKDMGLWGENNYTAIGIRIDEERRVKKAKKNYLISFIRLLIGFQHQSRKFWNGSKNNLLI